MRPSLARTTACAVVLSLLGCGAQPQGESASTAMSREAAAPADAALPQAPSTAPVQSPGVDAGQMASSASTTTDPRRRFVRTADARFQVEDVYASTLKIEDAVAAVGGFVASNRVDTQPVRQIERPIGDGKRLRLSEVQTQGALVVRVPSERTSEFLRQVAARMTFLDARTFEANDVQFDLLRRQLAFQRGQDAQADIARAGAGPGPTAGKVDAATARSHALAARDEAQVARLELEDRIAFSTLTLELRQPAQVREQVVPDTDAILRARGPGFLPALAESLRAGWRGLLAASVGFAALWPLWLAGLLAVAVLRAWRARTPRRAQRADGQHET